MESECRELLCFLVISVTVTPRLCAWGATVCWLGFLGGFTCFRGLAKPIFCIWLSFHPRLKLFLN